MSPVMIPRSSKPKASFARTPVTNTSSKAVLILLTISGRQAIGCVSVVARRKPPIIKRSRKTTRITSQVGALIEMLGDIAVDRIRNARYGKEPEGQPVIAVQDQPHDERHDKQAPEGDEIGEVHCLGCGLGLDTGPGAGP